MNPDELDDLRNRIDDSALTFDGHSIKLMSGRDELGQWSLEEIVDGMLDAMSSASEVDDMLDLGRHFTALGKQIRAAVLDHTETRGEP